MAKKSLLVILALMMITVGCIEGITKPKETTAPETILPPTTTQAPVRKGPLEYTNTNALVNPAWVEEHINDPSVRIIDLSVSKGQYDEGHIKGSVFVDWKTDIIDPEESERYIIAPKEMIETLLGEKGVKEDTTIVLYDNLDNRLSTRTFWTLRYYGHKDVRILNGGRKAWEAAGKSYTTKIPEIAKTTYSVNIINLKYLTDLSYIEKNLDNPEVLLIDGRPTGMYTGEIPGAVFHTKKEHARKGHIPGAINIPWKENLNEDGTFKSAEELKNLYEANGATKDKAITTYCNEGLHASPPWFVLTELLGYPDVSLYDRSMSEWANNLDVPIVTGSEPGKVETVSTYANPERLVDTSWVEEHLDDPNIRIIDLSMKEERYKEEHIPNAVYVDWHKDVVNPNADVHDQVATKEQIESLLDRLAITPETTLILYDNKYNSLSAYMYWALKYYGHKDVRILNGGLNKWYKEGRELTTVIPTLSPTTYSAKTPTTEMIATMDYILNNLDNPNVKILDVRAPKEYDGTLVYSERSGHIPGAVNIHYLEVLNEDNVFKSVEELKALYEDMGISKNDEIIVYCSAGFRAAHSWFVLKELLGYPNVRLYESSWEEWGNNPDVPIVSDVTQPTTTMPPTTTPPPTTAPTKIYFKAKPDIIVPTDKETQFSIKTYDIIQIGDALLSYHYDAGQCVALQTWEFTVYRNEGGNWIYEKTVEYTEGAVYPDIPPTDWSQMFHDKTDALDNYDILIKYGTIGKLTITIIPK